MKPRIEHKLGLGAADLAGFMRWLSSKGAVVLYPDRQVTSTYFDTPRLSMFCDTEEGVVPRRKVRVRCYGFHGIGCSSRHALEVKETTEHGRRKRVTNCDDWEILMQSGVVDEQYGFCDAAVTVSYLRSYLEVLGCRITIDRNIHYWSATAASVARQRYDDSSSVVEIKADANASPDWLANEFPFPRVHFSKYERAVHLVYPRGR